MSNFSHYGQSEEPEDEPHEINAMLAKLTTEFQKRGREWRRSITSRDHIDNVGRTITAFCE